MIVDPNMMYTERILVVDDTVANLQLLADILTAEGYAVHPATDGETALRFVETVVPDLILLDIRMPGMAGFEVCRRLKADERTSAVPIIFISMLDDVQDKVKAFQAGGVDYVTKPFQAEEVLARVKTHLKLRKLTERLEEAVAERTAELQKKNAELSTMINGHVERELKMVKLKNRIRELEEKKQ